MNENIKDNPVYVAYAKCGCICAACVDGPDWIDDTAKEIRSWRKRNMRFERIQPPDYYGRVVHLPNYMNEHPHGYSDPSLCPLADKTPDMFETLKEVAP